MAQFIICDKSAIQNYPFEDEVHDMADFVVAYPGILGPEVVIMARELQVPTVAGKKRLDFLAFDGESSQIDFEFIQLARFKDTDGKVYAVIDRPEIEAIEPAPARGQGTYDLKWYEEHSVPDHQLDDLQKAIDALTSLCDENSWDLGVRYVKWSVRFQTPGGRNAFCIHVRKTQKHHLTFCLGPTFDVATLELHESVGNGPRHKQGSRWWTVDFRPDDIKGIVPLCEAAYQNIMK